MRRILLIALALGGAATLAVVGTGAGDGDGGSYEVRAIFDNAVSVIPGESIKIAGVKVGTVSSLDITKDAKAAVVLNVTQPGFQDFRKDASCIIRPEGFIGEKYVECTPTQPHAPGAPQQPKLSKIDAGPGKGQYLLPVTNTQTPVDIDLINNIFRLPYAQRLSLILNEFGAGLAGRGDDLNEVIKRANPALQETDKVLEVLGKQNRTLAQLAVNSDTILAPLARDRARVANFVDTANTTAAATAQESTALEGSLERLPTFLRELQPTLRGLSDLSDAATPTLRDLGAVAPTLNRLVLALGPFADAALPATKSLGTASDAGSAALPPTLPVINQLRQFAQIALPVASNLDQLVTSIRDTGGIERILDWVFYTTNAVNGYDSVGRYLRAELVANLCSLYAAVTDPTGECNANFNGPKPPPLAPEPATTAARAAGAGGATGSKPAAGSALSQSDPRMRAAQRIYRGEDPQQALKAEGLKSLEEIYGKRAAGGKGAATPVASEPETTTPPTGRSGKPAIALPSVPALGVAPATTSTKAKARKAKNAEKARRVPPGGSAAAPATTDPATQAAADQQAAQDSLFNYLLGNDG
jgi:phospholipid/cholesterol/gamma-HCH transport system substrate-binding protein